MIGVHQSNLSFGYLIIILFFVVNGIFGLISEYITTSRGMKGGFWWGFFLSVIGLIVVAVRPNDSKETSHEAAYVFYCDYCDRIFLGKGNNSNSICPYCEMPLSETTVLRKDWERLSAEKKTRIKDAFANGKFLKYY